MISKQRVVCGVSVAAVWLIAIFLLPIWCLAGLLIAAAGVCLYELCAMLKKAGYQMPFWSIAGCGLITMGSVTWLLAANRLSALELPLAGLMITPLLILFLFVRVLLDKRIEKPMHVMALSVVSYIYIPFMLSFMIAIAMSVTVGDSYAPGIFLAFFLALITKLCDTGGYFIGSTWGKHKMCPRLSPGKSWEGTAGGYAFSLTATTIVVLLAKFTDWTVLNGIRECIPNTTMLIWFYLTIIIVIAVGILGDLVESLFKRQCGVKDSSALFPAMGGFFDTFDSLIFVPMAFAILMLIGNTLFC